MNRRRKEQSPNSGRLRLVSDRSCSADAQPKLPPPRIVPVAAQREIAFPPLGLRQIFGGDALPANMSLFHVVIPPRSGAAPPHRHDNEDEVCHVLDGTVHFLLGERVEAAGPGDTVLLPRGEWHANWNEGDVPVRCLVLLSQHTRYEHFFDAAARWARSDSSGDAAARMRLLAETAAEYGVKVDLARLPVRAAPFFGLS
jgi:uncharacterized cupin superfamily protein